MSKSTILVAFFVSAAFSFTINQGDSNALVLTDPQQCIEEKCPKEWDACQKDSKCIPTLQDCEKKCGEKKSCW